MTIPYKNTGNMMVKSPNVGENVRGSAVVLRSVITQAG